MDYLLFQEQDILELVDEYRLYCFYLQENPLIIGQTYPVPDLMRFHQGKAPDNKPGFGVFEETKRKPRRDGRPGIPTELLWKDQSTGQIGNIFALVMGLFGLGRRSAMHKICEDFGLGGAPQPEVPLIISPLTKKYADPTHIQIKSRPFNTRDLLFWDRYNIDRSILESYFVKALTCYWIAESQKVPAYPQGLGYAYEVHGHYQIYLPYSTNRGKRFRHNWTDLDIPGFTQLQLGHTCIITKSMKDVMCLRSYGYDAVAVRGESVMLSPLAIEWLKNNYKRILVLFDNDGKHRADDYEFEKIWIPKEMPGDKDISDYTDNHGPEMARKLLKSLI